MASEVVERLARAYAEWLVDDHTPGYEAPAHFFLNAIADYFETQEAIDAWPYPSLHPANVADFLRDQVGVPSDD